MAVGMETGVGRGGGGGMADGRGGDGGMATRDDVFG